MSLKDTALKSHLGFFRLTLLTDNYLSNLNPKETMRAYFEFIDIDVRIDI